MILNNNSDNYITTLITHHFMEVGPELTGVEEGNRQFHFWTSSCSMFTNNAVSSTLLLLFSRQIHNQNQAFTMMYNSDLRIMFITFVTQYASFHYTINHCTIHKSQKCIALPEWTKAVSASKSTLCKGHIIHEPFHETWGCEYIFLYS